MKEHIVRSQQPARLADYLPQVYPLLTPGKVFRAAEDKKIRCNGAHINGNYKVKDGDVLLIYLPDDLFGSETGPKYMRARQELKIIYEDENLLVVDKPAGLATIDESGQAVDTLINRILRRWAENGQEGPQPALCHRLDTGTSGVVLTAKNEAALACFEGLIRDHRLKKEYLCITFGRPVPPKAVLDGWLVKNAANGTVKILEKPQKNALSVKTKYDTLAVSGRLALLHVELVTGRTHQIRAHLSSIGCPVLGDSKYGSNKANRELKTKYQLLTSWKITLPREIDDERFAYLDGKAFTAEKPWYYAQILDHKLK